MGRSAILSTRLRGFKSQPVKKRSTAAGDSLGRWAITSVCTLPLNCEHRAGRGRMTSWFSQKELEKEVGEAF